MVLQIEIKVESVASFATSWLSPQPKRDSVIYQRVRYYYEMDDSRGGPRDVWPWKTIWSVT